MITKLLKWKAGSENMMLRIIQVAMRVCAFIIVGFGLREMLRLELTHVQWLMGAGIMIALILQCMIFDIIIDLKRKAA